MSEARQDFKKWQVDLVYSDVQEGQCAKCSASLENTGFHRHHKDGNNSNNEIDNLELLCPKCHHSTFGTNAYLEHKNLEGETLVQINQLLSSAIDPNTKMSGATLEKTLELITMKLKVSRNAKDLDYGVEYTPASIKLQRKMAEQEAQIDRYIEGYMQAVKDVLSRTEVKK
jgi:hypothetical protein